MVDEEQQETKAINMESSQKISTTPKEIRVMPTHLHLKFNAFICKLEEKAESSAEIHFRIYSAREDKYLSETFLVKLTNQLVIYDLENMDKYQTIFKDIDNYDQIYLVAYVYRIGKLNPSHKSTSSYKCPFGCSIVSLKEMKKGEMKIPIYTPQSESQFPDLPYCKIIFLFNIFITFYFYFFLFLLPFYLLPFFFFLIFFNLLLLTIIYFNLFFIYFLFIFYLILLFFIIFFFEK